jgi:hypothetical protein
MQIKRRAFFSLFGGTAAAAVPVAKVDQKPVEIPIMASPECPKCHLAMICTCQAHPNGYLDYATKRYHCVNGHCSEYRKQYGVPTISMIPTGTWDKTEF